MVVRTYKGNVIVNMDHVVKVVLQNNRINAYQTDQRSITLGYYHTEERASEVFEWLVNRIYADEDAIMPTKDEE